MFSISESQGHQNGTLATQSQQVLTCFCHGLWGGMVQLQCSLPFQEQNMEFGTFPTPVCNLSVKCIISHQKPCVGYSCLLFIAAFTWDWQEGHTDLQISRCCLQSQFCKKCLVPFCVTLLLMSVAKCPILVFVDKSFKLGLVLTMDIFNIIGKNDVKKHLMTIWYSCL